MPCSTSVHEAGCPDGDRFARRQVKGMAFKKPVSTPFSPSSPCRLRPLLVLRHSSMKVASSGLFFCRFLRQRATCGHGRRGRSRAHEGVRTGGIDGQGLVVVPSVEAAISTPSGTADPVAFRMVLTASGQWSRSSRSFSSSSSVGGEPDKRNCGISLRSTLVSQSRQQQPSRHPVRSRERFRSFGHQLT